MKIKRCYQVKKTFISKAKYQRSASFTKLNTRIFIICINITFPFSIHWIVYANYLLKICDKCWVFKAEIVFFKCIIHRKLTFE